MRTLVILFTTLAFKLSFAQQIDRKYTFKEVGWSFALPANFKAIDSFDNAQRMERGKEAIEQANDMKADVSQTRTLISATKDTYNYFSSTITPFDPKKDGDYKAANRSVRDMIYKTFVERMPDAILDSSTTTMTIDGLTFDKFRVTVSMKEKVLFNMFLLTKLYKGYDFGISYLYLDEETKEQIDAMLKGSKFTK